MTIDHRKAFGFLITLVTYVSGCSPSSATSMIMRFPDPVEPFDAAQDWLITFCSGGLFHGLKADQRELKEINTHTSGFGLILHMQ